ncbi:putative ubx domain-containing protein [Botrytis fragariae]|uniref:Putative ubx domain-containing protein n=1 Tax=Botrytis fragariae TaxID=1964551 RepID=A0A8H6AZ31_9HELO|nr:putative ubx domain-containing protein [Botrytis fragariae]KAF5876214.1 putative ubx domain-containing protein [Botrytis fragariae]
MADTSNHDELISQFCAITNASPSEAQQFLSANQWDYASAMTEFFTAQEEGNAGASEPVGSNDQTETPSPYTGPRTLDGRPAPDNGKKPAKPTATAGRAGGRGGIATLGSLNQGSSSHGDRMNDADDSDPDYEPDEQPRDLFAGGEKSGLAVQDPSRKPDARKIVGDILKQAKANSSRETGEPSTPAAATPSRFRGSGQTLGGDDAPSQVIPDPQPPAASSELVTRILHLWEDGFSVEDGPLRRFDDPANAQDLQAIQSGRAPLHLMNVRHLQPVYKPFGGSGQRLGSPTPGGSSTPPASASAPAPTTTSTATPEVQVDESQPTLTLRLQLANGTRLPARFNTTQTVGDVYDFIARANAGSNERAWVLATTFPNKEHTEKSQVLGEMPEFKRGGTAVQKWV